MKVMHVWVDVKVTTDVMKTLLSAKQQLNNFCQW